MGLAVHWRPAALRDAEQLSAYYAGQGGTALELGFLAELEAATGLLSAHPESRSTRYADLLRELPARLRFHPLRRFERILVYYMALPDRVEVIRIRDAALGLEVLLDGRSTD